jgi:hypothetical protein
MGRVGQDSRKTNSPHKVEGGGRGHGLRGVSVFISLRGKGASKPGFSVSQKM